MEHSQIEVMAEQEAANSQTGLSLELNKFIDIDKDSIRDIAMSIVDQCADGNKSWVDALIFSKKLNELSDLIKENTAEGAANELKLANKESRVVHGCSINEQMVGVKYSFGECGDPVWNELNGKIKEREAFLKTIKGSKMELIEDTGEVVKIFEPVKSGKMALIVKVK